MAPNEKTVKDWQRTHYGGGDRDADWSSAFLSERDLNAMRRLGKKSVLKRRFGFVSILGFCCTILISWETVLETLNFGLKNGGTAGLVYQYIFVWFGVMISFVTIGWLAVCGWQANTASGAHLTASLFLNLASVAKPEFTPQPYQLVLGAWAAVAVSVFINVRGGTLLPRFEATMLMLHVFGLFAVIIPLAVLAPKRDNDFVFKQFENGGEFPSQGLSWMVGILGMLWTFSGADGSIHLCEEIEGAQLVVPRSILATYILDGVQGFAMLIAILYCTQDVKAALAAEHPFIQIIQVATNSRAGTVVIVLLVAVMQICATTSSLAAASRQFWSFSRDHGVPGWTLFSKIEKKTSIPVYAVMLTASVSVLLQFINFGSTKVFENLVSLTIAGLYSSYLLATSLLLYRRIKGGINLWDDSSTALSNTVGTALSWGPWHVPGVFGLVMNIFVCCFLAIAWFFSFWPESTTIQPELMNYNSVLWGAVLIFSLLYYAFKGRKEYYGPVVEMDDDEYESDRLRIVSGNKDD